MFKRYLKRYLTLFYALGRGLYLTLSHLLSLGRAQALSGISSSYPQPNHLPLRGRVTLRYPQEKLPVPDHGRNQLHNEIEDCILCDKCARACPVDCIEIESVRAPELLGHSSNGMPIRLHAARFDIDMSKCCFCGLCTAVCPTECLTMQPVYDYSTKDIENHTLRFATLDAATLAKHQASWEAHLQSRATKES